MDKVRGLLGYPVGLRLNHGLPIGSVHINDVRADQIDRNLVCDRQVLNVCFIRLNEVRMGDLHGYIIGHVQCLEVCPKSIHKVRPEPVHNDPIGVVYIMHVRPGLFDPVCAVMIHKYRARHPNLDQIRDGCIDVIRADGIKLR